MRSFLATAIVAALAVSASAPALAAKEKTTMPKCSKSDPMVMVDTKTKMYHGMSDTKSHLMMVKSGDKTMMTCKSEADKMGAKMLHNGKPMM